MPLVQPEGTENMGLHEVILQTDTTKQGKPTPCRVREKDRASRNHRLGRNRMRAVIYTLQVQALVLGEKPV
jgi:hypothetical protein